MRPSHLTVLFHDQNVLPPWHSGPFTVCAGVSLSGFPSAAVHIATQRCLDCSQRCRLRHCILGRLPGSEEASEGPFMQPSYTFSANTPRCGSARMLRGSGHMNMPFWVPSRYLHGLLGQLGGWGGICWQQSRRRGRWCSRPCSHSMGGMGAPSSLQQHYGLLGRQVLGLLPQQKACSSSQPWAFQRRRPERLWSSVITMFRLLHPPCSSSAKSQRATITSLSPAIYAIPPCILLIDLLCSL